MWLSILTAIVCFAIATILFTPVMRKLVIYQALAFYFLFEGGWTVINQIVLSLWKSGEFMMWVHLAGITIFGLYLFYSLCSYYWHRRQESKAEASPPEETTALSKVEKK